MNQFDHWLTESYAQHPAFCFDQQPWVIDKAKLAEFSGAYGLIQKHGSQLTRTQALGCATLCGETLRAIFQDLETQALDVFEREFLRELHLETQRITSEELSFYQLAPTVREFNLARQSAPLDVLRLDELRHYFGSFPKETVHEILALGSADLSKFREAVAAGKLQRDDLSISTGPVIKKIIGILNREYRRQGVLDAVGTYMGQRMSVTGLALELSVSQATWWANSLDCLSRPPKTLYAHTDESIWQPKSIVYLSRVDHDTGPTSCYPGVIDELAIKPLRGLIGRVIGNVGRDRNSPLGTYYAKQYHQSMTSETFRRHFMRLPAEIRYNSHFGWDIYPGSAAEQALVSREHLMLGEAGTYIVFDGARLLHRGGMLKQGERVALQVIFSRPNLYKKIIRRIKRAAFT